MSGKLIDLRTDKSKAKFVYPAESLIPDGVTNYLVNVRGEKRNLGTVEVGSDGFCQIILIVDEQIVRFDNVEHYQKKKGD